MASVHGPVGPGEHVHQAAGAVEVPHGGGLAAAGEGADDARGQRLALGRAETAQHRHPGMELHPELVAGDLEDQLVEPHR